MSNFASLRTPCIFVRFSQMCLCNFCRFFPVGFGWLGLTFCQNFLVFLLLLFSYFFVIPAQFLSCHMICGFCAFVPRGVLRGSKQALIYNTPKKRMQTNLHPLRLSKNLMGTLRTSGRFVGNGLDRSVRLNRIVRCIGKWRAVRRDFMRCAQPAVRMGQDPSLHYYPKKGFSSSKSPAGTRRDGQHPKARR